MLLCIFNFGGNIKQFINFWRITNYLDKLKMLLWSKITFCLLYRVELYLCFAETIRHKKYEFAYHQYALQPCIVTIYKVISPPSRFHSHFPIEKVTDRYFCYRLSCIYILFVCLFVCFKKSGQICVATTDPRKGFCGESKLKK